MALETGLFFLDSKHQCSSEAPHTGRIRETFNLQPSTSNIQRAGSETGAPSTSKLGVES